MPWQEMGIIREVEHRRNIVGILALIFAIIAIAFGLEHFTAHIIKTLANVSWALFAITLAAWFHFDFILYHLGDDVC